ncbi:PilT/PilU family type 4a pilus ATPase [Coraliomargarita sp. SDUM461004]|uniref:PilT/PilU family type 4a pilus ATPase n=1 Tax=Thalassobacterium sedimentorum TaxID=3041258 RepID=A0ABU1AGX2_9BACT|nr:PilT/PilU family type 4a pilus ATPase [Coraliomargarita sp. SDUM461004]MDQ8194072.1 PilT/PilU family type 4a pilus ATPase [Coraliomargarita sp. SDUM461004]
MKQEIQWLVILGLEQKLFSLQPCLTVAQSLGDAAEIVPFAEELLREKACVDFDALQELVGIAYEKAQNESAPQDPFTSFSSRLTPASEIKPQGAFQLPNSMPDMNRLHSIEERQQATELMRQLLPAIHEMGGTDLHLCAGARPFVRHNRMLKYLHEQPLSAMSSRILNLALLTDAQLNEFEATQDLDLALTLGLRKRYRVNLLSHQQGIAGTYRMIPNKVPRLVELGFEDLAPIRKLLTYPNGLILVAGPICSGKSVTLAAMIDDINCAREEHLIAVEEPIEIVQTSKSCQITQREVGAHTHSFAGALKSALRQDPDIIVIGELRDLETIEMAITASETGHLVIGTLHTSDAANTLNRILDVFPASQQTNIRIMLSHALRGIICQRLVAASDGQMALAYELLLNNTAVRSLIQENKSEGLVNVMETGAAEGMRLMDKSILSLWESDRISDEVALTNLRSDMKRAQLRELIMLQKPTHLSN